MHLTGMWLTSFCLYMRSPGEGKKSFIGVVWHNKTILMLWLHRAAFFITDFADCRYHSAILFDCRRLEL